MSARGAWTTADRRQLLRLIVAKAGRNELSYQRLVLRYRRFRRLLGC
jgi:hypothetical protein